jgi:TetR/AcrR family transcriptional regulator
MGIHERKEREKEARREEIISAAQKIFFEKGLPASTMDEIAEAAELSKGTLYLYYKSKEDLYLAVSMRGGEILHQMFAEAIATGEPTIRLIMNLGETYYQYFLKHRNFFRMYYYFENTQVHKQVSEEMLGQCMLSDQKIWSIVIGLIQQGIDEGVLRADLNPAQAAVILWANGNALMRQIDHHGDDNYWKLQMGIDLEETMRKAYQFILESMMTPEGKEQVLHPEPNSH